MLPAVAQGALALEARADDPATLKRLAALEHPETRVRTEAERGFLARIEGGCQVPIAGHAARRGRDGRSCARSSRRSTARASSAASGAGRSRTRAQLGEALAEELLSKGADVILRECEGKAPGLAAPKRT